MFKIIMKTIVIYLIVYGFSRVLTKFLIEIFFKEEIEEYEKSGFHFDEEIEGILNKHYTT